MSRVLLALVALTLAGAAAGAAAGAQAPPAQRCELVFSPVSRGGVSTRLNAVKMPSGQYNSYVGGGVDAVCRGQSVRLLADSAEYYGETRVLYLIGNVHYTEPRTTIDSRRATYWMTEERLLAEGDVVASMPNGSVMRGPQAEYWRAVPPIRTQTRMVATGRPTITLVQPDSSGQKTEPVTVIADRVVTEADSLVYAGGRVEITRPDLVARGDSAFMDSGREFARLMRSPVIQGKGERPFTLSGVTVDLHSRERQLERVLSRSKARATSDDIDLTADTLDLRLVAGKMERAFAWGTSRAHATSSTADIVADSLDVRMPGQRVHEVRALRQALAKSVPDTTRIRSSERDWLRGDTIVAHFDTARTRPDSARPAPLSIDTVARVAARAGEPRPGGAGADTSDQPRLRELVALGNASAFYQIASNEGADVPPSINYVKGETITVALANQQVQTVTVLGQVYGVYAEPTASPSPAPGEPTPAPTPAPRSGAARNPEGERP